MTDFANAFLLVYAGLFPIVNPIGSAPIFLGLTASCTQAERQSLARRVAINSLLLLAGSMFVGSHLLVFFGITLPVVRIAGGMISTTLQAVPASATRRWMPALLIAILMPGITFRTCHASRSRSAGLLRSLTKVRTSSSDATRSSFSSERPVTRTLAPCARKRAASPRPMPPLPPVSSCVPPSASTSFTLGSAPSVSRIASLAPPSGPRVSRARSDAVGAPRFPSAPLDFSALQSAASGQVVVREDAGGASATVQIDLGSAGSPHLVAIAVLDGVHAGDAVSVVIDPAHTLSLHSGWLT